MMSFKCDVCSLDLGCAEPNSARGTPPQVEEKRAEHVLQLKFFSERVVGPWNSLPEETVEAGTTNTFKNKLDRYWTTNPNQS